MKSDTYDSVREMTLEKLMEKKLENVTAITVHPHKSKRYKILLQSLLLLFICKKRRSKNKTSPFCFPNAHCSKFPFLRKALCHNANNKI